MLTKKEIEKIRKGDWKPWLERHFSPFILSFFAGATDENTYRKEGFSGMALASCLYQDSGFLRDEKQFDIMAGQLKAYFREHSIFDITKKHALFYDRGKKRILELCKKPSPDELSVVYDIIKTANMYIWLTHGMENYYDRRLASEVPCYVSKDTEHFISQAIFPVKKTAHTLLEEGMRKNVPLKTLIDNYGWLKIRDVFHDPFTEKDLMEMKKNLKEAHIASVVKIPEQLIPLIKEMQELVYFRTHRTDVFYELLYLSRPVFKRTAQRFGMEFQELQHYTVPSLIAGNPHSYDHFVTFITSHGDFAFLDEPLLGTVKKDLASSVKGSIAYKGKVKGIVKIVKKVSELDKVKEGDILVTQMTFPSFISAMYKAVAFVTDEGGITCHAAIVAREMKKPCVIGTKVATKVFKDGDMVEVDAMTGVVRKI